MQPETLTWIEKQKPELVRMAEKYLEEAKIYEEDVSKSKKKSEARKDEAKTEDPSKDPWVKKSQLQNLLGAARAGEPVALLVNFVRYQHARLPGWRQNDAAKKLEDVLHEQIRPLAGTCPAAAKQSTEAALEHRYEVEAAVAAQLFGFILREYTYRCRLEGTTP
ncbi:MAG: hypothetical protein AAGC60_06150 [Acidobacteriota bacterium]